MKIPAEALNANENDRFAQAQGTRPVDVAARLASDLPEGFPTSRKILDLPPEGDKPAARRSGNNPERRQQDRRQRSIPITLDTRLARSRRKSESQISVAI